MKLNGLCSNRIRILLAVLLLMTACWGIGQTHAGEPVKLFNDRDLTGWKIITKDPALESKNTWTTKEGVLACTGKPTGYLVTEAEYSNYTLHLQWRYLPTMLKRPNSGVLVHVQPQEVFWPHSYEVQLAHREAGDIWLQYDHNGKLPKLTVDPARKDPANERHLFRMGKGETIEREIPAWNTMEIVAMADRISIKINGKLVNEVTDCSLQRGRIGLQAEGAEIEFREMILTPNR